MEVVNYSAEETQTSKHAPFFPKDIFCVIAGRTGSGKTNLILNFLLKEKILDYADVYIYCTKLYQKSYQNLKKRFNEMENNIKKAIGKDVTIGHFFESDEQIQNPKELDPKVNHIMIFDDVMFSDQTPIKEYFCTGRHNNVSVFYLCQSLFKIAKHCIRDNANIFILFHQKNNTLESFHNDTTKEDMDFEEFKSFCKECWSKKHGFAVINLWEDPYCGRYISNYTGLYVPNQYLKTLNITNNYIKMTNNDK